MLPRPSRAISYNSNALPGEKNCIISSIKAINMQKRIAKENLLKRVILNLLEYSIVRIPRIRNSMKWAESLIILSKLVLKKRVTFSGVFPLYNVLTTFSMTTVILLLSSFDWSAFMKELVKIKVMHRMMRMRSRIFFIVFFLTIWLLVSMISYIP